MFSGRRRMGRGYEEGNEKANVRISRDELGIYARLLGYVRPYTKWMVVSIIALLFSVGLGLILPLVVRNLVDLILVDNDLPQSKPARNRAVPGLHSAVNRQLRPPPLPGLCGRKCCRGYPGSNLRPPAGIILAFLR